MMKLNIKFKEFYFGAIAGIFSAPVGFFLYTLLTGNLDFRQPSCQAFFGPTVYASFNGSHCNILSGIITSIVVPFIAIFVYSYGLSKIKKMKGVRLLLWFSALLLGLGGVILSTIILSGIAISFSLPFTEGSISDGFNLLLLTASLALLIACPPVVSSALIVFVKKMLKKFF